MKQLLPYLFSILFLSLGATTFGQKYITKTGHVKFYSETPMETIEAHNKQVNCALDAENGNFVFKVLIKSFEFEKALMQEHFNENYMESDKIPSSTFSGKVENLGDINLSKDGEYEALVKGDLSIHGVTKQVEQKGTFTVKGGKVHAKAVFMVMPADYDIKIAKAVVDNIAKEIEVTVEVDLDKMK